MQIEQPVVGGRWIYFEIAGMNNHAERGVDSQRHAIHQAMRDLDGTDGKWPDLETLTGTDLIQLSVVEQAMLVQFVFDVSQRELGAPHGHVQFAENPGQRPDVVFVSVSENDAFDFLAVLREVRDVGNNNI